MSRLRNAVHSLLQTPRPMGRAGGEGGLRRILLYTFPNTGTSFTLSMASRLTGRLQCSTSSYRGELTAIPCDNSSQGHQIGDECPVDRLCGKGACELRDSCTYRSTVAEQRQLGVDAYAVPVGHVWPVLVKSHGVAYGNRTLSLPSTNRVIEMVDVTYGGCGKSGGVDAILGTWRNPYDTFVARFHLRCHNGKISRNLCGAVEPTNLQAFATAWSAHLDSEVCVQMRWYHSFAMLLRHQHRKGLICPQAMVEYELIYRDMPAFIESLVDFMSDGGRVAALRKMWNASTIANLAAGSDLLIPRNISIDDSGMMLPVYLQEHSTLFYKDAATVIAVAQFIQAYLDRSGNLSTSELVDCNTL